MQTEDEVDMSMWTSNRDRGRVNISPPNQSWRQIWKQIFLVVMEKVKLSISGPFTSVFVFCGLTTTPTNEEFLSCRERGTEMEREKQQGLQHWYRNRYQTLSMSIGIDGISKSVVSDRTIEFFDIGKQVIINKLIKFQEKNILYIQT